MWASVQRNVTATGHIYAWHVWEKMVNSGQGTKQSAGNVGGWREGRQLWSRVTLATARNLQKLQSKTETVWA